MMHYKVVRYFTYAIFLGLMACANDNTESLDASASANAAAEEFDFVNVFASVADAVVIPNYKTLAENSRQFAADSGMIHEYCLSIGTENEAITQSQAQDAWLSVMEDWQHTEAHLIGPVTANSEALRNRIHSFANTNLSTCGVDQAVILAEADSFDVTARLSNQRGLGAIEYLLFNDDLEHTCPGQITETQTWNARSDTDRKRSRCEYSQRLAQEVSNAAEELYNAWLPTSGNYRFYFVHPNNAAESLSMLSAALFFIDVDVKDKKLGLPAGLNSECNADACPSAVESFYSESSLDNIRANLEGFRAVFTGGALASDRGFDDFIVSQGFSDVAIAFTQRVDEALTLIDSSSVSLLQQTQRILTEGQATECVNSVSNFSSTSSADTILACRLYGVVKDINDRLRTDFVTIVNVDLPSRAQSDND